MASIKLVSIIKQFKSVPHVESMFSKCVDVTINYTTRIHSFWAFSNYLQSYKFVSNFEQVNNGHGQTEKPDETAEIFWADEQVGFDGQGNSVIAISDVKRSQTKSGPDRRLEDSSRRRMEGDTFRAAISGQRKIDSGIEPSHLLSQSFFIFSSYINKTLSSFLPTFCASLLFFFFLILICWKVDLLNIIFSVLSVTKYHIFLFSNQWTTIQDLF